MSNVRWNFRLGPLQFNSRFGAISSGIAGAVLLMCCCGGIVGAFSDDDEPPSRPAVDSSALSTSTPSAVPRQVAPSPTKSPVVKSSPTPKRTTSAPKPSATRKPPPVAKDDPRYGTCKEANGNGYGPYVEGEDPEYDWYQDRDGDGTVCETS